MSLHNLQRRMRSLTFFPTWLGKVEARLPVGRKMGPIQMVSDSFAACEDLMLQRRAQFLLCHGHPGGSKPV